MTIEVIAVGGYEEIGKNMTAVKVNDDVVIFDQGPGRSSHNRASESQYAATRP